MRGCRAYKRRQSGEVLSFVRMEHTMTRLSITAAAGLIVGVANATAAELPSFEKLEFPITTHQLSVTGSAYVRERSPSPTFTLQGMPASPHQVMVLTPRSTEQQISAKPVQATSAHN